MYKKKFTTILYNAIFVDLHQEESAAEPESNSETKKTQPEKKTRIQIIRTIYITVYNPFGHKIDDTTISKLDNFLENAANHVHINSRHWIINNRLLFQENDTLNILELSETERLLRQAVFINDARITVIKLTHPDSVDVNVEVYDKWPIAAPSYITDQGANIRFINQNLFGVGQQFEQYVGYKKSNVLDISGKYTVANLDNTYISSQLNYNIGVNGTSVGLSFDRPYFSPIISWAGGISVTHDWGFYNYTDTIEGLDKKLTLNNLGYDVWVGKSFKLKKTKTLYNQSTNIIVGGRYYTSTYLARPSFDIDSTRINSNTYAFIGNIGFSVQQYYKDKFIYRFGSTEDVPEGFISQVTYGVVKKEFKNSIYYIGMEIARAKKFNFGYVTTTISRGIFFSQFITNDITNKFNVYYLGNLLKKGRWSFRQFADFYIVSGENKVDNQTITLTYDELYGFNNSTLSGNTKIVLKIEAVAYAPYDLIGFRFASVIMAGLGLVGSPKNKIDKSPLYQAYSLGVMVRNEHLVSSTFQISVGIYPFLPDGHNNVILFNPITSFTLRVRGFSMGKPEFISY